MPTLVDRGSLGLARLLLRVFFRRVEVVGLEHLPDDADGRPWIVVANHVNGLIDPLLLFAFLPLRLSFLGKSTLWKILPLRPLLKLGRVIPVYRRQDAGVDTSKNQEMFSRCYELMAEGGTLALFPEGKSHNEPGLEPLRTGAARILLGAEERFGPLGGRVLPVGLVFEAKERFRSRALLRVGPPLDPQPEVELHASDPQAAVRRLTERIAESLTRVTLGYGSWEEASLIGQAAEIYARPSAKVPRSHRLAQRFELEQAFVAGYRELQARHPEEVRRAREALERYHRLLRACRLSDAQVASSYPAPPVLRFLLRTLATLFFGLPATLIGALLNWPPYRLAGWIGGRTQFTPDVRATYKLYPSLLLFPIYWLTVAGLVGARWGPGLALLTLISAPFTGWVALMAFDAVRALLRESRAFLMLKGKRWLADELRQRRQAAYEAVAGLVVAVGPERAGVELR